MKSSPRWSPTDAWLVLGICAATAVVLGKDLDRGALADADSSTHIMDGVLIHDWIMAGPKAWASPMEFATRQYAHYPTLGIGQHYPPGFAIVEAVFFAVFGISGVSARLCVVFFGMLAGVGLYAFVRGIAGRLGAILAALVWLAFPATTLWGRQTMLEIPTLAILIWGAICFAYYLHRPGRARLMLVLTAALLAILFKQTGVFLVCAIGLTLCVLAARRSVPRSHAAASMLAGGVSLLLVVLSFDDACFKTFSGYSTYSNPLSLGALSFYPRMTPYLTGTLVLVPAVLGAVVGFCRLGALQLFLLCWLFVAYVMLTAGDLKVPRFSYVCLPPLAVWAGVGLARISDGLGRLRLSGLTAASFCLALVAVGFNRPVKDTPDYSTVVEAHRQDLENKAVLFSGLRDGDFVFAVRQQLPWLHGLVVRGSKLFYTCTAGPDLDLVSYVEDEAHLAEVMRRLAFEYVFVERENLVGTPHEDWLRRYLNTSEDYRLIASHGIAHEQRVCGLASVVDVYTMARPLVRSVDFIDLPMPRTGRSIRVTLEANSFPGNGPS